MSYAQLLRLSERDATLQLGRLSLLWRYVTSRRLVNNVFFSSHFRILFLVHDRRLELRFIHSCDVQVQSLMHGWCCWSANLSIVIILLIWKLTLNLILQNLSSIIYWSTLFYFTIQSLCVIYRMMANITCNNNK